MEMLLKALFSGILFFNSLCAAADLFLLKDYLSQVREKHLGYQGSTLMSEGAILRSREASLLISPTLISNLQYLDDQKPTNNPAFLGNRTVYQSYSLGVAQQTQFGLLAKLTYNMTRTELSGVNTNFVPMPKFYNAVPSLELSQSLWRNGLGSETRATMKLLEAQAKATGFTESLKSKIILAEAESVYWRLTIAHELVAVAMSGVERAKKIREWSGRRASLALADKGDALQAEAGLQGKQLELQMALDEEREASKKFNSMRGQISETTSEELEKVNAENLLKLAAIEKKGKREDVLAADEARTAAQAASQLGRDKNAPTVDLVSSYSLNGRDPSVSKSISDATQTNQSTFIADRAGYIKEEKGAELNYQRKLFDEEMEWNELNLKFSEAKRRLGLAKEIEKTQQKKLENERARMKMGRSVLYQVVLFEQDYANSQLLTLKTELQFLAFLSQMKTYLPLGETP